MHIYQQRKGVYPYNNPLSSGYDPTLPIGYIHWDDEGYENDELCEQENENYEDEENTL